ncbi:hypothetical protein NW768_007567 [Fusarium equiseti]|uniref:Uncharacterized protein n=1 Tax=Fusarium equiseti TaxID=61235 RepID=A0ABQ8R863_FUSEQ|nr:hypothetical protein NW768_007567 [Fusarium equiseti]
MSSQQNIEEPLTVDPSSSGFHESEVVDCMRGAELRTHSSKHIKTRLDELWGKDGWIPPFQHKLTGKRLTVDSLSYQDVRALLYISNLAAGAGIVCASLYEPRGLIYGCLCKVNGVPKWTDHVAKRAKTRAKNLWKGGLPRVSFVTHPRVPHSEPTSEQASAIPSSDVIDPVSDDGEILFVETFDDRSEDDDLCDGSINEQSHTTPLDHHQDVSNINHTPLIPSRPVRQSTASNMFSDIPGARVQLKNGRSLPDEDVKDLIRHFGRSAV